MARITTKKILSLIIETFYLPQTGAVYARPFTKHETEDEKYNTL